LDEQQDRNASALAQATKYLGVGLTWVGSTGLFLFLGSRLDRWWGTKPIFTLIGAFVGAVAGFYYLYRQMTADLERSSGKRGTERKE
jgi:F0F1-type ATP synthase assembly protein I